jgi:hypothetical protein
VVTYEAVQLMEDRNTLAVRGKLGVGDESSSDFEELINVFVSCRYSTYLVQVIAMLSQSLRRVHRQM